MKYLYRVFYKNDESMNVWRLHGLYNKTDALGTASLCLLLAYAVKIVPVLSGGCNDKER